jgi:hypothetical protein
MMNACNPSTWGTEAGRSKVQSQLVLHGQTLSKKKKKERKFSFLYYTYFFKVGTISSSLSYKFSHLFNRVLLSWNLFLVGSEVKKIEKQSK